MVFQLQLYDSSEISSSPQNPINDTNSFSQQLPHQSYNSMDQPIQFSSIHPNLLQLTYEKNENDANSFYLKAKQSSIFHSNSSQLSSLEELNSNSELFQEKKTPNNENELKPFRFGVSMKTSSGMKKIYKPKNTNLEGNNSNSENNFVDSIGIDQSQKFTNS